MEKNDFPIVSIVLTKKVKLKEGMNVMEEKVNILLVDDNDSNLDDLVKSQAAF